MTNFLPNWRERQVRPISPNFAMSATSADKRAAEEIANRDSLRGLREVQATFSSRFKKNLKSGIATDAARSERSKAEIQQGEFFIVGGQMAYVAEVGEDFTNAI